MACAVILLTGAWPMWRLWQANPRTSLRHAVAWSGAAWIAWLTVLFLPEESAGTSMPFVQYLALSLTSCAGIAVLGARRPGVGAWDLVVAALLALNLLAVLESMWTGRELFPGGLRMLGLAGTLLVGIANYFPTRFCSAALVALLGAAHYLGSLFYPGLVQGLPIWMGMVCIAVVPWIAHFAPRARSQDPAQQLWLDFRNRFGFVWGERVREQFNRAVSNAGRPLHLHWRGFDTKLSPEMETQAVATLAALMKRFADQ
jgi:hypothetical protein